MKLYFTPSIFFSCIALLVLPLAFLLWAQWPLRELVQAHHRTANDAGQVLFALYMAVAVTAASRAGVHLAAKQTSPHHAKRYRWGLVCCVLPWALYLSWASIKPAWQALRGWERFPETLTPGYFFIHASVLLLAVLALLTVLAPVRGWLMENPNRLPAR